MTEDDVALELKALDWNIVALQLCQCSYQPTEAALIDSVPLVDRTSPTSVFKWQTSDDACSWPESAAEVVFVAELAIPGSLVGALAVVIRGTDFSTTVEGIFEEVAFDLSVLSRKAPPWLGLTNIQLSRGAYDDYKTIAGFTFGGGANPQSLVDYVAARMNACKNSQGFFPQLVVTGHSLGGCQVSVVAAALAAQLPSLGVDRQVFPISFAAPTAGNAAFAGYFHNLCPSSRRISNTLDIVPHGWAGLRSIATIYDNCRIDPNNGMPALLKTAITDIYEVLRYEDDPYKQPETVKHLTGQCLDSGFAPSWVASAAHQHHTTTYMKLLGGTDIPTIGASMEKW